MTLINEFKRIAYKDNDEEICEFLDRMAESKEVFSTFIPDFTTRQARKEVYFYASSTQVVIVLIDKFHIYGNKCPELADEEPFGNNLPLYFGEMCHRLSPVWRLHDAMETLKRAYRQLDDDMPEIFGILLSDTTILNYEDMFETWDEMDVRVVSEFGKIDYNIQVNNLNDLPGAAYYKQFIKSKVYDNYVDPLVENYPNQDLIYNDEFNISGFADLHDDDDNDGDDDSSEESNKYDNGMAPYDDSNDPLSRPPAVTRYEPIENPEDVLDTLIGLGDIKRNIRELVALVTYNRRLHIFDPTLNTHKVNLHAIFTGPVGTGKTTVGRIYGSLLHKIGMLSKGHVIAANRGSFIGKYWGSEEEFTRKILDMAQGGVLFIDEAYELNTENDKDPGRHVLQLMLETLADEQNRDIAIVLAGYEKPMEELLTLNAGLESRFTNRFKFEPFSIDDLLKITKERISAYRYKFTATAWAKYKALIAEDYRVKDETFGNARYISNLLEKIYIRHAKRCVDQLALGSKLLTLTSADIPEYTPKSNPRKRIGFN